MLAMFAGFGLYFLYDGMRGYPQKNYVVANYQAFSDAGKAWESEENRDNWENYVKEQTIPFMEDRSIYPKGTDFEEKWPEILKRMGNGQSLQLWKEYSGEKGWSQEIDPEEDVKDSRKIGEQFWAAAGSGLLALGALYFLIRTKRRVMKVTDEGYYPPGKGLIPFGDMLTLDKRKWDNKGLATITYREGDEEKKARVDGMVYGQFKEEEGAPAEALFQKILSHFEGELIELVDEEDEEGEDAEE